MSSYSQPPFPPGHGGPQLSRAGVPPAGTDPVACGVVGCGLVLGAPLTGLLLVCLAMVTEYVGLTRGSPDGHWGLFWTGVALPFAVAGVVWGRRRRGVRERRLAWEAEQQFLQAQAAQRELLARQEEAARQQRARAKTLQRERARAEAAAEYARWASVTESSDGFDTWHDPAVEPATTEWERCLNAFALRSAGALVNAGVPLFRSRWSRGGRGTYKDAFWLLAVDVSGATRSYVRIQPSTDRYGGPNDPRPPRKVDYVGNLHGTALLLTRSGIICAADYEGFLTRFGGVDNECMDMIFRDVTCGSFVLSGGDGWGRYNQGRWRLDRSLDSPVYGVALETGSMRFEERWRRPEKREPGYETSAALSGFVKSNGETHWPRHFTGFERPSRG